MILFCGFLIIQSNGQELETGDCDFEPQPNINWYNCDKSNLDLKNLNLRESFFENTNFSGSDLSGTTFKGSDLVGTNFEGANLTGVDFTNTLLINVNFKNAIIDGIIVDDAHWDGLDFSITKLPIEVIKKLRSIPSAKLQGMSFEGWDFTGKTLMSADLRDTNLSNGTFVEAFFNEAQLQNANLSFSNFKYSIFNGANLQGANLISSNLQGVNMENANLENAILFKATLAKSTLIGANLKNADVSRANLTGAYLKNAILIDTNFAFSDLSNSNLRGTKLKEADLTGANLKGIDYPPKLQLSLGISISEISCKPGFRFVEKASDNSPACINPFSVKRLVELGWTGSSTLIPNVKTYEVTLDPGKIFHVTYFLDDAKLIEIKKDQDSNSVIVNLEESKGGILGIVIPREILDAKIGVEDDRFFVLIDGEEVYYNETVTKTERTLTITFPAGAKKIEIIAATLI